MNLTHTSSNLLQIKLKYISDLEQATHNADLVTTDVWASMGQEHEQQQRLDAFSKLSSNTRTHGFG